MFSASAGAHAADCANTEGIQPVMNECAAQKFGAADEELNIAYHTAMVTLNPSQQNQLRIQQRAWLKNMERHCTQETADEKGGQIWSMLLNDCRTEATEKRTAELKKIHP